MEELMGLLGNIESLLSEIKQMLGVSAPQTEPATGQVTASIKKQQEEEDKTKEEEKKKKEEEMKKSKTKKSLEDTPSDGVDANDDAEERIEEEPGVNEENIKDVTKSFAKALQIFAQNNKNDLQIEKNVGQGELFKEITDVMKQLASKLSDVQKKQDLTEEAILNILKGWKIADEVEKSLDVQQQTAQKGLNNVADNEKMANLIKSLAKNTQEKNSLEYTPFGRHDFVQKGLHNFDLLKTMVVKEGE